MKFTSKLSLVLVLGILPSSQFVSGSYTILTEGTFENNCSGWTLLSVGSCTFVAFQGSYALDLSDNGNTGSATAYFSYVHTTDIISITLYAKATDSYPIYIYWAYGSM